jgi:UDP-2-acetamido-3-amino-2,3-dideoxy-glucuronate N-acetyltransferase
MTAKPPAIPKPPAAIAPPPRAAKTADTAAAPDKPGASIGANATIVCGHDIGEYAFIGAGAVVTKTVPAYALVVGNPAKQIGWISEYGHKLDFDENNLVECKESGQVYELNHNQVKRIK